MVTVISRSPDETGALGEAWGREAQPGWVIGLTGDLGAGKTQLVKGIARGLGIGRRISSPTFGLVNEHEGGRLPLFHLDLYRLDRAEQIVAAGLEHYLQQTDGVTVVEWAERWFGTVPGRTTAGIRFLRGVTIETLDETVRRIRYEDSGA